MRRLLKLAGRYTGILFVIGLIFCSAGQTLAQMESGQARKQQRVMAGVRFDGSTSVVSVVVPGGPADRAGIKIGDEILSVGESFVVQPFDLMAALDENKPGDVVTLEVRRGSDFRFFDLKLINAVKGDVEIGDDGKVKDAPKLGVLNELGPELTVDQWSGIPEGVSARLKDNRGKVICILLFQSDCEWSLRRALPELKAIQDAYQNDSNVLLLAIQTPFRNFEENTHGAAIQLFESRGLTIPLGHDGSAEKRTVTYDDYRAYGTPWFIVMDKQGVVRFNDTSLPIGETGILFERLKMQSSTDSAANEQKPAEPDTRSGSQTGFGQ